MITNRFVAIYDGIPSIGNSVEGVGSAGNLCRLQNSNGSDVDELHGGFMQANYHFCSGQWSIGTSCVVGISMFETHEIEPKIFTRSFQRTPSQHVNVGISMIFVWSNTNQLVGRMDVTHSRACVPLNQQKDIFLKVVDSLLRSSI